MTERKPAPMKELLINTNQ